MTSTADLPRAIAAYQQRPNEVLLAMLWEYYHDTVTIAVHRYDPTGAIRRAYPGVWRALMIKFFDNAMQTFTGSTKLEVWIFSEMRRMGRAIAKIKRLEQHLERPPTEQEVREDLLVVQP